MTCIRKLLVVLLTVSPYLTLIIVIFMIKIVVFIDWLIYYYIR